MTELPRPRIPRLLPARLNARQRTVYDAIAGGRRSQGPRLFQLVGADGALEGPFNAFLLSPGVGDALQALGAAVRYETELPDRAREIAILVVAVHHDAAFEWYAHEAVGRQAGLTGHEFEAIRSGRHTALATGTERLVADTTLRLLRDGSLDDEEYAAVTGKLGAPGLFELLSLVGYYSALALQLRVFRVGLPVNDATR